METPLYIFQGGSDGAVPGYGDLLFDGAGNIYGTTEGGGTQGVVYELTPSGSGYKESVLYSFSGGTDGSTPYNGVIFDNAGNLYGTTYVGGLSSVRHGLRVDAPRGRALDGELSLQFSERKRRRLSLGWPDL